jgi:hypothetical protein
LKINEEQANRLLIDVQAFTEEERGDKCKPADIQWAARRFARSLGRQTALRQILFDKDGGVRAVLEELRLQEEERQLVAMRLKERRTASEDDSPEALRTKAFISFQWWIRAYDEHITRSIDQYYKLSPESLQREYADWVWRPPDRVPPGWAMQTTPDGKEIWWNPSERRFQHEEPEFIEPDASIKPPEPRDPPVWLLDLNSVNSEFDRTPLMVKSVAIDVNPMHQDILKADFAALPVIDAGKLRVESGDETWQTRTRFGLREDGSIGSAPSRSSSLSTRMQV